MYEYTPVIILTYYIDNIIIVTNKLQNRVVVLLINANRVLFCTILTKKGENIG